MSYTKRTILTESDLVKVVPSAFFTKPAPDMSDKYTIIKTTDVINEMEKTGWFPYSATETVKAANAKRDCRYHMIKFFNPDAKAAQYVGDSVPEVVLFNSNNGRKSFQLEAGVFRLACSNGMMIKDHDLGSVRKRHIGQFNLQDHLSRVKNTLLGNVDTIRNMQETVLNKAEREELAKLVLDLRYTSDKFIPNVDEALQARRPQDVGNSAWLVLNKLQEAVIRGGITLWNKKGASKIATPITSPHTLRSLNEKVYDTVAEFIA